MALYNERLGETDYNSIIASLDFPVLAGLRTITAGSGALKAGTALAISGGTKGTGKLVVLGTAAGTDETLTPSAVLCADVDATAEVKAEVYLAGYLARNKVFGKDNAELTDAQVEEFRKVGIYLENIVLK